jgi:cobalt-precorrin-5B (C1)-methyltransferase
MLRSLSDGSGAGYTLPVFAVAATIAALNHLLQRSQDTHIDARSVQLDLLDGDGMAEIAIEQGATLGGDRALAVTVSDPGENLDLTRNTPIWAEVGLVDRMEQILVLQGGEGLGRSLEGEPAIYHYARRLFEVNVEPLVPEGKSAIVQIILPEGRALAARTSNAAFGIVEGLSLLGTSGISKPLSAESHLEEFQQSLRSKASHSKQLVFCIGSNGMQVADRLRIDPTIIVQTGNWIGALLLEAGLQEVRSVHLLGYQGKLIKLAGGIFNTSSHLADAKLEILSAAVIQCGGNHSIAQSVLNCKTADEAYRFLVSIGWTDPVFSYLVTLINQKSQRYVKKYTNVEMEVQTTLFDRLGHLITTF